MSPCLHGLTWIWEASLFSCSAERVESGTRGGPKEDALHVFAANLLGVSSYTTSPAMLFTLQTDLSPLFLAVNRMKLLSLDCGVCLPHHTLQLLIPRFSTSTDRFLRPLRLCSMHPRTTGRRRTLKRCYLGLELCHLLSFYHFHFFCVLDVLACICGGTCGRFSQHQPCSARVHS